eukprot:TRINITY_DN12365_c0_g1_i1.p1 TRINITY_DN12365_c0_g1~~TRINITY_DN12365_c0_g1_i1.p1  ORF type:complete len:182 (-),score=42.20 TRINITY_DN12365_c0_g1_i1:548-1093(-)
MYSRSRDHGNDSDSSLDIESSLSNNEVSDIEIPIQPNPKENILPLNEKSILSDELTEEYIEDSKEIAKKEQDYPNEETVPYENLSPKEHHKANSEDSIDEELIPTKKLSEESKEGVCSKGMTCVLCWNPMEEVGVMESCAHYFCFKCIKHWSEIENTCPICKKRFNTLKRSTPNVIYCSNG